MSLSSDENEEETSQPVNNLNSGVTISWNKNKKENNFFSFRHVKFCGEIKLIFIFGVCVWLYELYGNTRLIFNLYDSMLKENGNHSETMTKGVGGTVENITQHQHPPLYNVYFYLSDIFFAAPLVIILGKCIGICLKEGKIRY